MRLRLSLIHFANALPLQWGFMQGRFGSRFEISFDSPARCADRLARGDADVGLIPAVEYQRIGGLRIIPGMAIASKKRVESVLFVSRRPLGEVRSVALDTSSRTSVVLVRLLLRRKFLARPIYRQAEPDLERMLETSDSALIIGNPALLVPRDRYYVLDLVEQWVELTGLPFVFAFWAVRRGLDLNRDVGCFLESKAYGLSRLGEIADYTASSLAVPRPLVLDYLEEKLNYDLDADNLRGLEHFYRLAAEEGLIPPPRPLAMVEEGVESAASDAGIAGG